MTGLLCTEPRAVLILGTGYLGKALAESLRKAGHTALTADIDAQDSTKIVPRLDLADSDFDDLWIVGDYSDKNGEQKGGFIAIHMMNALSTGGFQMKTSDKAKGQFAFEYTAHFAMAEQTKVPYEIYIKAGDADA